MPKVVILGAGRLGRALECILKERASLELWDADNAKHPDQKELEQIIPGAEFILVCTPSWTLREALIQLKPLLKRGTTIVVFQKGIEAGSHKLSPEIAGEVLGQAQSIVYIGGPMMAEECLAGQHSFGVAASADAAAGERIAALFSGSTLRLEVSSDMRGVPLAGVLKNVYSLALGIAAGLGWGINARGWLGGRAIAEMELLMKQLGGEAETVYGAAGIGDFLATAFSDNSRNRTHGIELASQGSSTLQSEGGQSLPALLEIVPEALLARTSLLAAVKAVVIDGQPANQVFEQLTT